MERLKIIKHCGREIVNVDFSGCAIYESLEIIKEAQKLIATYPKNSVLTLTNVTETEYTPALTRALKEYTALNKDYVKAAAVIGVSGIKQMLLKAIMVFSKRKFEPFNDAEKAVEWLIQQ